MLSVLRPSPAQTEASSPVSVKTGRNSSRASLNKQSTEQSKLQRIKPQRFTIDSNTRQRLPLACLQAPSQNRSSKPFTGTPVPWTAPLPRAAWGPASISPNLLSSHMVFLQAPEIYPYKSAVVGSYFSDPGSHGGKLAWSPFSPSSVLLPTCGAQ